MISLLRCISIALVAMIWPLVTSADPGSGRDGDRDRYERSDDDSSGRGGSSDEDDGDHDYDSSGPGSGEEAYYVAGGGDYEAPIDSDNSGSGAGGDYEDNSGPGTGDAYEDNSDPGGGNDNSGTGGGDPEDHSGPGGGGDDSVGAGGDEDDHSGPGGGDDAHADAIAHVNDAVESAAAIDHHHFGAPLDVERDDAGQEFVSGEALLLGSLTDVAAAVAQGFELVTHRRRASDGRIVARLVTPAGMSVDDAIDRLRAAAPTALVSRNTIFRSAQAARSLMAASVRRPTAPAAGPVLGVIDTGADSTLFRRGAVVATRAFASSTYAPREHGSIVASIAVMGGARVQIADVFEVATDGEIAASADAIVAAIDWMVDTGIPVINVSIEGPENPLLTDVVRSASARGHIIVAAAGNGGPMAAPVYPAALEGAVAITAVDQTGHAYRRANRGSYIAFAARGVDLSVTMGANVVTVSGTSFAAPRVAARLASVHQRASPEAARIALEAMRANAIDLGRPGRDPVFGWGLVAD